MKLPILSIIIPVYNSEAFLPRCLDSVLAQTMQEWECILVDDGTPDGAGVICDEYVRKDKRFKVIHKTNKGVSAARNDGLDTAIGCWVSFVDSDDFLAVDYYENLFRQIKEDPQVDFVHGCGTYYNNGDTTIIEQFDNKIGIDLAFLMNNFKGYVCGKLFKRSLIESQELGGPIRYDDKIRYSEDMVFTLEFVLRVKKYAFSSEVGYFYNKENNESATHTIKWTYEDALYAFLIKFRYAMTFVEKEGISIKDIDNRVVLLAISLHQIISLLSQKDIALSKKAEKLKQDVGVEKLFILKFYQIGLIDRIVKRLFMADCLIMAFMLHPLSLFESRIINYCKNCLRNH